MSVDPISAVPSRPSPGAAGARLGELYAKHARMVYGICRMLLRDPDDAEDATQQVFLAAYGSLLTGTEVRDPAAWLGTIARNACRRRAIERSREAVPTAADRLSLVSPALDDEASAREALNALYAELAALPQKQREAVVLRDLYGLRYDEVAGALGTSRPAVESLLFRGRRRLRRRLRPGLAAGVLAMPVAIQESIAYAVPGFAGTASAGAAAAVGVPLAAKLAATTAAVGLVGSAGLAGERSLHDPPSLPASVPATLVSGGQGGGERGILMSVPPGGFPALRTTEDAQDDRSGPGGGGEARDDEPREDRLGPGGGGEASDDEPEDRSGPGDDIETEDDDEPKDRSGPGGGVETEGDDAPGEDRSGPGDGKVDAGADDRDSSGPGGGGDESRDEEKSDDDSGPDGGGGEPGEN